MHGDFLVALQRPFIRKEATNVAIKYRNSRIGQQKKGDIRLPSLNFIPFFLHHPTTELTEYHCRSCGDVKALARRRSDREIRDVELARDES